MKRSDNIETHERYETFKKHQVVIDELQPGDTIVMTVNGKVEFQCTVENGVSSHVNVLLQDKGPMREHLTHDQQQEAFKMYRETQSK